MSEIRCGGVREGLGGFEWTNQRMISVKPIVGMIRPKGGRSKPEAGRFIMLSGEGSSPEEVSVVLTVASLAASFLPARRAARIQPMRVLHREPRSLRPRAE